MISMTWPQYLRRECRIGDFLIPLSPIETELLLVLLVRYPAPVTVGELIDAIYPDPDREPEFADDQIRQSVRRLARRVGTFRIFACDRLGYRICQRACDPQRWASSWMRCAG
jgi:hypothetical protein